MKKKGGSIASDRVNSLIPKSCNSYPKYPTTNETNIDRCFTINNYSTTYKTTGGSKKKGGSIASDKVNALSNSCSSNPDNQTTKDTNIDRCFTINNYSTTYKTTGGKKTNNTKRKNKIKRKNKTKKGGRVLMPQRYFNPNNYGNYRKETSPDYYYCGSGKKKYSKKGGKLSGDWWPLNRSNWGDSIITGAKIPKSTYQHVNDYLNGKTTIMTQNRSDPTNHTFPENNNHSFVIDPVNTNVNTVVDGFNELNITNGDTTLFKNNDIKPSISPTDFDLPMMKAGSKIHKKRKGGGSDWMSTVYSRGSYTSPNMSEQQFNSFNKSSPYISNIELANGAANHYKSSPLKISNELHTPGNKIPVAYNELDSLPIKQFGKGKNKMNRNII